MSKRSHKQNLAIANKMIEVAKTDGIGEYIISNVRMQIIMLLQKEFDEYCDNCYGIGFSISLSHHNPTSRSAPAGRIGYRNEPPRLSLVTADCQCVEFHRCAKTTKQNIELSKIPARYVKAQIADYKNPADNTDQRDSNEKSLGTATKYASKIKEMHNKGYGLFLCGPNGVGKTYLACAIGLLAIRQDYSVRYYTMPKIVQTVIAGWYEKDLQTVVDDIETADFLIIDDLDKAYTTKTGIEKTVLDNLFRERLQNNRPMLVTSNKTVEQLKTSHGVSTFSMFKEHCVELVFVGSDHRKKLEREMIDDIMS